MGSPTKAIYVRTPFTNIQAVRQQHKALVTALEASGVPRGDVVGYVEWGARGDRVGPALQCLLEAVVVQRVTRVVVRDASRLARRQALLRRIVAVLEAAGAELWVVTSAGICQPLRVDPADDRHGLGRAYTPGEALDALLAVVEDSAP